jgi:hypothetical protein
MNGLTGNKERHARSHFQIVIRLQMVRAQVHDRLHRGLTGEHKNIDIDGILMGIQGVAVAAREAGLAAFTSVCLHVCERIEPSLRIGYITRPTLALVAEWAANAELYLRRPRYAEFAKALVFQLNDPQWGSSLDPTEQAKLLHDLSEPCS